MRRKGVAVALASLAIAALTAWLVTRDTAGHGPAADAEPAANSTTPEPPGAGELAGGLAARPHDLQARAVSRRPGPKSTSMLTRGDESEDRHRRGRVIDTSGGPIANALVIWTEANLAAPGVIGDGWTPGDELRLVLGTARTGADGSFDLVSNETSSLSTSLCVAIEGRESFWARANERRIEVRVPDDVTLVRGVVLDPDGHPVPDLSLRLTDAWASHQYVPIHVATRTFDAGMTVGQARFVTARTDSHGRFEVHVRNTHGLGIVSASPKWFLRRESAPWNEVRLPADLTSLSLVALPAVTLHVSVLDAKGEPVGRFDGHALDADGSTLVDFAGKFGTLSMAWPRPWKSDERKTINVDVEAADFAPARAVVLYEPGATEAFAEVRLAPAAPPAPDMRADVTFEIRDSTGRPFDGDWVARIVGPGVVRNVPTI